MPSKVNAWFRNRWLNSRCCSGGKGTTGLQPSSVPAPLLPRPPAPPPPAPAAPLLHVRGKAPPGVDVDGGVGAALKPGAMGRVAARALRLGCGSPAAAPARSPGANPTARLAPCKATAGLGLPGAAVYGSMLVLFWFPMVSLLSHATLDTQSVDRCSPALLPKANKKFDKCLGSHTAVFQVNAAAAALQ